MQPEWLGQRSKGPVGEHLEESAILPSHSGALRFFYYISATIVKIKIIVE